jgi:hypothetical protein
MNVAAITASVVVPIIRLLARAFIQESGCDLLRREGRWSFSECTSKANPAKARSCWLAAAWPQIPAGKAVPLCRLPLLDSARRHGHAWLGAMGQHKNNKRFGAKACQNC